MVYISWLWGGHRDLLCALAYLHACSVVFVVFDAFSSHTLSKIVFLAALLSFRRDKNLLADKNKVYFSAPSCQPVHSFLFFLDHSPFLCWTSFAFLDKIHLPSLRVCLQASIAWYFKNPLLPNYANRPELFWVCRACALLPDLVNSKWRTTFVEHVNF